MDIELNSDNALDLWVEDNATTVAADCCKGCAATTSSFSTAPSTAGSIASAGCASTTC
ncbi:MULTISPECIES: hypothetical protein [Amycolatopsis]|uniref:Uncharacterized protein n=1 Tax=Amycolatopsis coloradensis TaxID=76021 RepID=A0ACD5BDA4_9PSEU|nr:hypothetical protein [Amycolatopsis decaplanina]